VGLSATGASNLFTAAVALATSASSQASAWAWLIVSPGLTSGPVWP
jgi:hypothetical protein